MRKYLLMAGAALIGLSGSAYAALDCNTPPSCDELGYAYSSTECDGQSTLKCPFDQTKVFCGEPSVAVTCTVGALLYNDLKCYDEAPSGKNAIGVVFDATKRLAISLSAGLNNVSWGGKNTDISTLTNCEGTDSTSCDPDGKSNTQKIIAALGESGSLAAGSCYTSTYGQQPKGSWFLPSMSELTTLYANRKVVNASLTAVGSKTPQHCWSSNEYDSSSALYLTLAYGDGSYTSKNTSASYIYARCAIAY